MRAELVAPIMPSTQPCRSERGGLNYDIRWRHDHQAPRTPSIANFSP